jgi:hypothetical protein
MALIDLETAINLLRNSVGQGLDAATEINLVTEEYMNGGDPPGTLERVTFTVTTDANGQGFITLPTRYSAIRGAVKNTDSTELCGWPLEIRNGWFEYTKGHLGMLKWPDPMSGIIPIPKSTPTDPVKYKVPVCPTQGDNSYFTCICKLSFTMLENDSDVLPIQNVGALEVGLLARAKRRSGDYARESQLWAAGRAKLAEQKDNDTGPEAYGKIQMDDDYALSMLGDAYGWYDGGWGGWWR